MGDEAAPSDAKASSPEQNNAESLHYNDEIVDYLMLLDYESQFCNKELKPMPRTFFVYAATNTAHQFKYFTQLIAWCLKMVKQTTDWHWDEYDDPNTVITKIMVALKDLQIDIGVVPGKLRQGWGESVCLVLHSLLKDVLRRTEFQWGEPTYPDEGLADEADVDSDAEIQSVCEDELPDGEEEDVMYREEHTAKDEDDDDHGVLEANIDPREWLLEVEKVAPKLKIQMPNDSKEWRTHLSQTKGFKQVIEGQFPAAKSQLDKLSKELSGTLERIKSKEQFINKQFDRRAGDYRSQQEELTTVQTQYTQLNEVVMNLQIDLKGVTEELEQVKGDTEERSSLHDTAPNVKMKDAFKRLRADTRQLEVRIGVVSHTLMQAKLVQRPQENNRALYPGGPAGNTEAYDDDDQ